MLLYDYLQRLRAGVAPLEGSVPILIQEGSTDPERLSAGPKPGFSGTGRRHIFFLHGQRLRVGREGVDIRVHHESVSREHAELTSTDGVHQVVDLGSTNGTFVDGRRLVPGEPETLHSEALVRFGLASFVFLEPHHLRGMIEQLELLVAPALTPPEGLEQHLEGVSTASRSHSSGTIEPGTLTQLVTQIASEQKTGTLIVMSGECPGRVTFRRGDPVSAHTEGGQSGASAVLAILGNSRGRFVLGPEFDPAEARAIESSFAQILLPVHREESRRQAAEVEDALEAILDSASDVILACSGEGYVERANAAAQHVFQRSRQQLEGCSISELFASLDHGAALAALKSLARTGERWELSALRHSVAFPAEIAVKSLRLQGRPAFTVCLRDMTRRKEAERALRRSELQQRQADQFASLGRLAAGIAHDFNNALTAISGHAQLLAMKVPRDSPLSPQIDRISDGCKSAAALVRQLLDFGDTGSPSPQVVELSTFFAGLTGTLEGVLGAGIEWSTEAPPGLSVNVVPQLLQRALVNLATNARDAMGGGGTWRVKAEACAAPQALGALARPFVKITAADTGPGIRRELRERIFEPFFTTKARGEGSGLGLATIYGFARSHDGLVDVVEAPGGGACFRLFLPADSADAEAAEAPCEPDTTTVFKRPRTVLVLDDEQGVRDLAQGVLSERGFTVLSARDGEQALEYADAYEGPIDLLLADLALPGLEGDQVAALLRESRPQLQVAYVSGKRDGPADSPFLRKPFNAAQLLSYVASVLRH